MLKPEPGSANSLRSDSAAPGSNANFRPLTSLPLLQMHRGGRTLRCAWGPIYVVGDGSDLHNEWIHLFFRNLLFLLENRHTLLTFLLYTIFQIVDEPLKTISPLIMKEQPAHPRAVLIFALFLPHPPSCSVCALLTFFRPILLPWQPRPT